MKTLRWTVLLVMLVPLQAVVLPYLSVWNVKPDLGLVAVCLIGLLGGELDGLLAGLMIGWVMSLFSAEEVGASMLIKGGVGLLTGAIGRQLAHLTPLVVVLTLVVASTAAGIATASALRLSEDQDLWWAVGAVVLPQACFDAVVGALVYWLAWDRPAMERWAFDQRI